MTCLRSTRPIHFSNPLTLLVPITAQKLHIAAVALILAAVPCFAQDQSSSAATEPAPTQSQPEARSATITIPAGTQLALVLTQPVQSRYVRRGDDIYAQINAPVSSGNATVIPAGTFVQGAVDKIERHGGRGELRLQSMSITFPDGYVVPIPGPMTLVTDEGYAQKDPGKGRVAAAFILPMAGGGLGALIGHAVGNTGPQTLTASIPDGCTGTPPGCISSSMTVPGNSIKGTAIGGMVGLAAGGVGSLVLLMNSRHFYLDAGSPVEMRLQQSVTLQQSESSEAVRQSGENPVPEQPVAPRPVLPHPNPTVDHSTCWTPGTPGTPPTTIPGAPGPDGIPGPPIMIPGTPPIPGTPYPCP